MLRFVTATAFLSALALVGCGGGGGGSSASGGSVTPGGSQTQLPALPASVQRSDIQTGLQSVTSGQELISYGSSGTATTLGLGRSVKRAMARSWTQSATCQNGFTESVVQTGPNTATATDQYFYDTVCTKLWKNVVATVNVTLGTATGAETIYSMTGSVIGFDTLALSVSQTSTTDVFSIELTGAANPTSTPFTAVGLAFCSVGRRLGSVWGRGYGQPRFA
jgi:hypothetical protein